ncbi:MAG TPA: LysR family transcriptional regulator [Luteibacter sp.]|jgi:DNA-binding transcriptional LysR family regulator|nr:LysR family transcriptional regulator [Luteibacter sp.]
MAFDERLGSGMGVMLAVVDAGSFAKAADILDMTQSGVSRAIARLESRLGVRLFERTTRSVKLTDEGRRFHERIVPLLGALEEAADEAAGDAGKVRGRLRVNTDPLFSSLVLAPRLGGFIEAYPDLQLELVASDRLGDLIADGFDIAIRFGPPRSSTMIARHLLDVRVLTVAAPAYLDRHGRPKTPQELAGHVCIDMRDPESGQPFSWDFHRGRKMFSVATSGRLVVNEAEAHRSVCLSGHGIAQIISLGLEPLLTSGQLVELFPDWPDERWPLYALFPSRRHMPAKMRAFLDFVIAAAGAAVDADKKTIKVAGRAKP